MTVKELRERLDGMPDNMKIGIWKDEGRINETLCDVDGTYIASVSKLDWTSGKSKQQDYLIIIA